MPIQGITNVANAIVNKINNRISSHNSNSNAHQDIRASIPVNTGDLVNTSQFITASEVAHEIEDKEDISNKIFDLSNVSDDDDVSYPTANAVKNEIAVVSEELNKLYVQKSNTDGLIKNDGTITTIADNLTTNDATQVLSAKQGKVLNDLIGDAIEYINQ